MNKAHPHPPSNAARGRGASRESGLQAGSVDEQAAEWLIRRLGQDWSPADQRAWQHWLQASPRHAAAYAHAESTWSDLAALREAPELLAAPAREAPAGLPPRGFVPPAPRPRRMALRGLAAVLLVAAVAAGGSFSDPVVAWRADHRTAVAEVRGVALPDGSRLVLAGDSAVAVRYSAQERRIDLLKGEALFEARSLGAGSPGGERRPFVVEAGGGVTRALGTKFIVERLSARTQVTAVEHQVSVAPGAAAPAAVILSPGQVVRYGPDDIGPVQAADVDAGRAWVSGLLVFERAPLADVAIRLNRYFHGRIVVRGNALERRQVSGVFKAADSDGALRAIADELHVRLLRLPGLAVLY